MPRSGVAVPREGASHHEDRVATRRTDSDPLSPRVTPRAGRATPRATPGSRPARSVTPGGGRSGTASRPAPGVDARPERRTVTIRGRGSERYVPARSSSRRRPERRYERAGFKPDRTALWAVLLGLVLILVAATSAHAATLHALVH
jgi:hypothetical protein